MDKLVQQLLKESFLSISPSLRSSMLLVIDKLLLFGQLTSDLLILLIKTMDGFDLSEVSLNYNNSLLELLYQRIITQNIPEQTQLAETLADNLFYKLLRMLTVICLLEEETFCEYKSKCVTIVNRLFTFDHDRCLALGWTIDLLLKEL